MIPARSLGRRTRRVVATPIQIAAAVPGADAYRKHFPATAHLWLLVWHTLSAASSLRQTHAAASADPTFWVSLGLPPTGVSRSQLARSSRALRDDVARTVETVALTTKRAPRWFRPP